MSSALVLALAGCGGSEEKPKATDGVDKDGLDRYSYVSSAVSPADWTEVQLVESAHPYANDFRNTWSVSGASDAVEMRVVFERIDLENGYDFVTVSNASGGQVSRNTGSSTNLEAIVTGARVDLLMTSDYSVTGYGFRARVYQRRGCSCPAITAPVCGSDGRTYPSSCHAQCANVTVAHSGECVQAAWIQVPETLESVHPYDNNFRRTWTLSEGGARRIRVHFTRIDVERAYDFVRILDARGAVVHEYTGRATDVVSDEVAGDTIQIQLASDNSVTGYGFAIDRIEVQGGCTGDAECRAGESCIQPQCIRAPCFKVCAPESTGYQTVTLAALQANPQAFNGQRIELEAAPALGSSVCTRIACPTTNPCCNRCSSGYSIGGDVSLVGANEQGYGCSGDECNPTQSCNPAFGRDAGPYLFRGTFRLGAFDARQLVVDSYRATSCRHTGCSGQVCANVNVTTTCEVRPEYACYRTAACEAQADGFCAWTQTATLEQCLANAGGGPRRFSSTDTPMAIPDNRAGGVTSRINVSGVSTPRSLTISLAITHTYRGDLKVTLIAPDGRTRLLQDRAGGSFDNLVLEDVDVTTFANGNATGTWALRVEDLAAADTGTFTSWSLSAQ